MTKKARVSRRLKNAKFRKPEPNKSKRASIINYPPPKRMKIKIKDKDKTSSSGLDGVLNPLLQTSLGDNLLHIGRELTDLVSPLGTTLTLLHLDLATANVPGQGPASAASESLAFSGVVLAQTGNETGNFETHQGVVDAVSGEDVAKAAGDNKGDLLGENGGSGLLARATAAEVEAGDQDVALLGEVGEVGVVVGHADLGHGLL